MVGRPLRKNLGKKNCELGPEDIERICQTFLDFEETEESKIFENEAFGYWKVTVERPLRLAVDLSEERVEAFFDACVEADEVALGDVIHDLADELGPGPHFDFTGFLGAAEASMRVRGIKMTAKRKRLLQSRLGETDEIADPVVGKVHRTGTLADPIRGRCEVGEGRTRRVVEYVADTALRDVELIPLREEGGIVGFLRREVLPYAPDAWYVPKSVKIGYEISFNRYFYKPEPMRTLDEIRAEITAVERESEGLLGELLPGVRSTVAAPASWGIGGLAVREPSPGAAKLRGLHRHIGDRRVPGRGVRRAVAAFDRAMRARRDHPGDFRGYLTGTRARPPGGARYSDVHRPGPFGRDRDHARGREPGEPVH